MQNNIEKAILSTIILNPELINEVSSKLKTDNFLYQNNQKIYKTIIELYNDDIPIDEDFIRKKLNTNFYDNTLIEIISTNAIANLDYYVKELIELSNKDKLTTNLLHLQKKLNDQEVTYNQILQDIETLLDHQKKSVFSRFNPLKIDDIKQKQIEYFAKEWLPIPKGITAMLTAKGGTGKSFAAIQLAYRITENTNEKVLLWLSEDPLFITKNRSIEIENFLKSNYKKNNIDILGNETIPFHIFKDEKKMIISDEWFEFKEFAKNYDFIVLDPLIAFFGGDENSNSQARYFMNILNEWCIKENKTILLIHHHNKLNNESRGAGAFIDAVRLHYIIYEDENELDTRYRKFEIKKDNWGIKKILNTKNIRRQIFSNSFQKKINSNYSTLNDNEFMIL